MLYQARQRIFDRFNELLFYYKEIGQLWCKKLDRHSQLTVPGDKRNKEKKYFWEVETGKYG